MKSNLARRALAVYENLPLPAGSAVGVVAVLVLERVRPAPLPGPRAPQLVAGVAAIAAGCALNGWALSRWTDSPAPYLDSFVTWGSIVTTWMVARRIIENWLYWIVFDGAAVWLYYSQGLLALAALFIIYLGIVVRGYFVWRRDQALQSQAVVAAPST